MSFRIEPLPGRDDFGAVVTNLAPEALGDPQVRRDLNALWIARGVIVFRGMDGIDTQVRLSEVFGSSQEHPLWRDVDYVPSEDKLVIDLEVNEETGDGTLYEIDGEVRGGWLPWHFDGTYSDEINRGGILRAVVIPEQGGETGFIDRIAAFEALPRHIKEQIENLSVVYSYYADASKAKFGILPDRTIRLSEQLQMLYDKVTMRSIHPMVLVQKETGRKVLSVSPWFADGIEGMENDRGDELLREVIDHSIKPDRAYYHKWQVGDMVLWDNWRMLHCARGVPLGMKRHMRRTTIMGNYGLGRYETEPARPVARTTTQG